MWTRGEDGQSRDRRRRAPDAARIGGTEDRRTVAPAIREAREKGAEDGRRPDLLKGEHVRINAQEHVGEPRELGVEVGPTIGVGRFE